jgi:hypothetical protein
MFKPVAFRHHPWQKILAASVLFTILASGLTKTPASCPKNRSASDFLVIAGGGHPSYNEIALEKNVLYFQRILSLMGFDPAQAQIFFANGNDGRSTIRYLDTRGAEQFKAPEIPHLSGAATIGNFLEWLKQTQARAEQRPIFFYFTGHGAHNREDENNSAMIFWNEEKLSVQQFAQLLDRMPPDVPVVTMMAQCYSGSFANFIYEQGQPQRAIAPQTRCGFFATLKSLPSVGCTPEVNEADYRDYSSSFFAGLSGRIAREKVSPPPTTIEMARLPIAKPTPLPKWTNRPKIYPSRPWKFGFRNRVRKPPDGRFSIDRCRNSWRSLDRNNSMSSNPSRNAFN